MSRNISEFLKARQKAETDILLNPSRYLACRCCGSIFRNRVGPVALCIDCHGYSLSGQPEDIMIFLEKSINKFKRAIVDGTVWEEYLPGGWP